MSPPRRLPPALLGLTLALGPAAALAAAPLPPATIAQELRSLRTTGSVLHLAAHPDDENTELITYLARGRGYRTAYLSLTRGDGGQNELGSDFDEKLGYLRTHELIAARRLDHGRQFFTRAIDFGYSKSPEETLRFWDRDQVLADVVRVIRQFRPDVIVTRFPVPPGSGGHGHHTASGILAVEAFHLAGDPTAFPGQLAEGLTPWQPARVFWNVFRFNPGTPLPIDGPLFTLDIAGTDPITGESFGLIAAHSRAMHKTQGLGGFVTRARTGANDQTFLLLAGSPAERDLMDGLDTTWLRHPGGAAIDASIGGILDRFDPAQPAASVPALLALRVQLAALPTDPLVTDKRAQLDRILAACLGLRVQTTVERPDYTPGEAMRLQLRVALDAATPAVRYEGMRVSFLGATADDPTLRLPVGKLIAGRPLTGTLDIVLPPDAPLTQPYWLREEGEAGISRVSDPALIGLPENPPAVRLEHVFTVGNQTLVLADEPVHQPDAAAVPRRIDVVAPVSLSFGAEVFHVPPGGTKDVTVSVAAARPGLSGTVRLDLPAGWRAEPAVQPFVLSRTQAPWPLTFAVTAPADGGVGRIGAVAEVRGQDYAQQRIELRYAHLPPLLLQPPARARLVSFALDVRSRRIGYLPGAGDATAAILAQMGCDVRELTGADLTPEKLAGLDAVVIGVRAFNEREDLKENLPGLFAWVEQGGTVVAQYNQPNSLRTPTLAPFPLSIEGPAPRLRVTDEDSPVELLAPGHPALAGPNRIGAEDFDGWVQERGAYFPSSWDEARFTPLLAMNDPGEAPLRSGVLVARHGRGHYVYASLAFFRQLPAGVPGAWRLFANLVSLGKDE